MVYDYCAFLIKEIKTFDSPPEPNIKSQICEWYAIKLQKKPV